MHERGRKHILKVEVVHELHDPTFLCLKYYQKNLDTHGIKVSTCTIHRFFIKSELHKIN